MFHEHHLVRPTVTVQIRDLSVTTRALVGSAGVPTVGNVLPQAFKDVFLRGGQTTELKIIHNINTVLKPVRRACLGVRLCTCQTTRGIAGMLTCTQESCMSQSALSARGGCRHALLALRAYWEKQDSCTYI
jgi:hypothetical protein